MSHSFTLKARGGLLRVLQTQVQVCPADTVVHTLPDGRHKFDTTHMRPFVGIWDTGATNSVITEAVVKACGLKPIGIAPVMGVFGEHLTETYLVNIGLPNAAMVQDVQVSRGHLPGGEQGDLLIGMDIISMGDFAVTSRGGETVFSFRLPGSAHIDFVAEHKSRQALVRGRPQGKKRSGKNFGKKK